MVLFLDIDGELANHDLRNMLKSADHAVYKAIAESSTERVDEPLRKLSETANYSRLWLAIAALMRVLGGPKARRAASSGVASIAVTSFLVNVVVKSLAGRARPDRDAISVPDERRVSMPASSSFPSGHSASAFAFATAVGKQLPPLALPLRVLAAAVAYSRIHSGVHYPVDVLGGSIIGIAIGHVAASMSNRRQHGIARDDHGQ